MLLFVTMQYFALCRDNINGLEVGGSPTKSLSVLVRTVLIFVEEAYPGIQAHSSL